MKTAQRRHPAAENEVFYIVSPGHSYLSGGPMALHLLCHHLNETGYEAYLYTDKVSGTLRTPMLTQPVIDAHIASGRRRIGIYPEIQIEGLISCDRVIRYLLNRPGARSTQTNQLLDSFWRSSDRENEFNLHYADEFQVPYLQSASLYIPIEDREVYFEGEPNNDRHGFLVYSHRKKVTSDMIPEWARPYTMIEMSNYKTPDELAELYRRSEAIISFERTGAVAEALLCGCPAVCVPSESFEDLPMFSRLGNFGVGWGSAYDQLEWAKRTLPVYRNIHSAYVAGIQTEVKSRIEEALAFFSEA